MRSLEPTAKFKKDYKREKKTDRSLDEDLTPVLDLLANDAPLPAKLRDHALSGTWVGYRDCHVRPDLVLVYAKKEGAVTLVRLGSHAELFG